jgi:hypothetical protein
MVLLGKIKEHAPRSEHVHLRMVKFTRKLVTFKIKSIMSG